MTADRPAKAGTAVPEPGPVPPGTTRITARALERLATYLVRDAAHVHHSAVSVRLTDTGGAMKVSVTAPVVIGAGATGSVAERGEGLRREVIAGMRELGGRRVDTVDVRWSGVRRVAGRRAR